MLAPGARALLGSSIVARVPLAMFSIALLVHAQRLTGSFAIAGVVSAAYAIASAAAAPLVGGLVDRYGQTRVLVCGGIATALAVTADGLLPAGSSALVLIALAAAAGACTPPLDACVRTLLSQIVGDPDRLSGLFALESTLLELTFVAGPPLALGLGALWSPGIALVISGCVLLAGTIAFAVQGPSRRWRASAPEQHVRGGALASPAIRTLLVITFAIEAAFGATEVGVTAATHATSAAAGPLLGLWGAGSLVGGIIAVRAGGGASSGRGLIALLGALAIGHGALVLVAHSTIGIAVVITLAGATIAPTVSTIYSMVDAAAPAGTETVAFSWLTSATLVGASLGNAVSGALAQSVGAAASFALAGSFAGVAVVVALLGLLDRRALIEKLRLRVGHSACPEPSSPARPI